MKHKQQWSTTLHTFTGKLPGGNFVVRSSRSRRTAEEVIGGGCGAASGGPTNEREGIFEKLATSGVVDGAVSVEDGGAVAVVGHSGEQGEGGTAAPGASHDEVPAGEFSSEGK